MIFAFDIFSVDSIEYKQCVDTDEKTIYIQQDKVNLWALSLNDGTLYQSVKGKKGIVLYRSLGSFQRTGDKFSLTFNEKFLETHPTIKEMFGIVYAASSRTVPQAMVELFKLIGTIKQDEVKTA